ncbi:hypothetical protein ACOME3_000664 [Neoechinorhynchus agilis]
MLTIFLFLVSVRIAYNLPKDGNLCAHLSNSSLSASTTLSPITDEQWPNSWHLHRSAYNIERVWNEGYTGKGVVVGVIDYGIEQDHPDLNDSVLETLPNSDVYADHGNGCAGIIAGKPDNNICGVGIAYDSKIISLNAFPIYDHYYFNKRQPVEASYGLKEQRCIISLGFIYFNFISLNNATLPINSKIDIYSMSLGEPSDGSSVKGLNGIESLVLANNAQLGRNGLGSSFVITSGNGGQFLDNCAVDGRVNSHYAIAVAGVLRNHSSPSYAEKCAAIMTSGYTSEDNSDGIITAGLHGTCQHFGGTSAATPMVAAIIALGLEANPDLDYRQIQYLVVMSSVKHANMNDGWWKNGAGHWVSNYFGFGILDPKSFVDNAIAMKGSKLPESNICKVKLDSFTLLESDSMERFRVYTDACNSSSSAITSLEHVILNINIQSGYHHRGQRGKLRIVLVSPSNNSVEMLPTRPLDDDKTYGFPRGSFTSVLNWFEDPRGYWEVQLFNSDETGSFLIYKLEIMLIGVNGNPLQD